MSSDLFKKWLQPVAKSHPRVSLYTEKPGARLLGLGVLKKLLSDHFVGEGTIVQAGGEPKLGRWFPEEVLV